MRASHAIASVAVWVAAVSACRDERVAVPWPGPDPPRMVAATALVEGARLSWSPSEDTVSYVVYAAASSGGAYSIAGTTTALSLTVEVAAGEEQFFRVAATGSSVEGVPSGPIAARGLPFHFLTPRPVWIADGEGPTAVFGLAIAAAGDVNGDGFGDMLVGATGFDGVMLDAGRAYLYLGTAMGLRATASWFADGPQAGAAFGDVGSAGDLDGDGFDDFLVGAPLYDDGATLRTGLVRMYRGGPLGPSLTHDREIIGGVTEEKLGQWVAPAGDVDGDGNDDVFVSGRGSRNGQADEGFLLLLLGSALTEVPIAESNMATASFAFRSSSRGGDVNGDGTLDLAVGAHSYDSPSNAGAVMVFHGQGSTFPATPTATVLGTQPGMSLGLDTLIADVDCDGYGDVVAGAESYSGAVSDGGAVFAYRGGPSGIGAPYVVVGTQTGAAFGDSIASLGDLDGDGCDDLAVSAFFHDELAVDGGRVFLVRGDPTGPTIEESWTAIGDLPDLRFGGRIAVAGDVNGDGTSDLVVGTGRYDGVGTDSGRAYLYLGGQPAEGPAISGVPVQNGADVSLSGVTFSDVVPFGPYSCSVSWGATVAACTPESLAALSHRFDEPGPIDVGIVVASSDGRLGRAVWRVVIPR